MSDQKELPFTVVTPTFDLDSREWYLDDGTTAKSLRELQAKLPPGTVLEGYYPDGYGQVVRPRTSAAVAKVTLNEVKARGTWGASADFKAVKSKTKTQSERRPRSCRSLFPIVNWNEENKKRLVDFVDQGMSARVIAEKFGCSRGAVIGACQRYRLKLRGGGASDLNPSKEDK